MMTHDHVKGLDDLKDKTILVATPGRTIVVAVAAGASTATPTRRPRPTPSTCSRSSPTRTSCSSPIRRPSRSRRMQKGVPVKFFLFADNGYPPYGTTMVDDHQARRREARTWRAASCRPRSKAGRAISRAIRRPRNALIKADNPKMSDEQIAFGIKRLNELEVARRRRRQDHGHRHHHRGALEGDLRADGAGRPAAEDTDWKKGFTTQFVKDLKITVPLSALLARRDANAHARWRMTISAAPQEDCRHRSAACRRRRW